MKNAAHREMSGVFLCLQEHRADRSHALWTDPEMLDDRKSIPEQIEPCIQQGSVRLASV